MNSMTATPPIEAFNALSLPDLQAKYFEDVNNLGFQQALPQDNNAAHLNLSFESASSIKRSDMLSCFRLIESTSKPLYAHSTEGWSAASKKNEMHLTDMRYVLVRRGPHAEGRQSPVIGFMSFMATYEDSRACFYCYEIHLDSALRGKSLGRQLMTWLEDLALRADVPLIMLTAFTGNEAALRFYSRLGYVTDDFSPRPRSLRNGREVEADYRILSKKVEPLHRPP